MTASTRFDPAHVDAFWREVAHSSDSAVTDMVALAGSGSTAEFDRLTAALSRVHPGLLLLFGYQPGAARPELVISAGGDRSLFGLVPQVVDAAPAEVVARYDVRAFRPRVPDPSGMRIRVKGRDLGVDDVGWVATPQRRDRTRCDVDLFIPGWIDALPADSPANEPTAQAVFLLLDHLVGEWAVEAQIGGIGWSSPARAGTRQVAPLSTLPEYLDRLAAS